MSSWVTNEARQKTSDYRWAKQQDIYLTEYHGYIIDKRTNEVITYE
jgi:hypothetical protein